MGGYMSPRTLGKSLASLLKPSICLLEACNPAPRDRTNSHVDQWSPHWGAGLYYISQYHAVSAILHMEPPVNSPSTHTEWNRHRRKTHKPEHPHDNDRELPGGWQRRALPPTTCKERPNRARDAWFHLYPSSNTMERIRVPGTSRADTLGAGQWLEGAEEETIGGYFLICWFNRVIGLWQFTTGLQTCDSTFLCV